MRHVGHAKATYCLFGVYEPFVWKSHLEVALSGWYRISGIHQGGATSIRQVGGDFDMVPTWVCKLGRRGLNNESMGSTSSFVWEETAPPVLTLKPDNSVPPCLSLVPLKLLLQHWSSE